MPDENEKIVGVVVNKWLVLGLFIFTVMVSTFMSNYFFPKEVRTIHTTQHRVVETRVKVPVPDVPKMDPADACRGAKVKVMDVTVQDKNGVGTTWLRVMPVGYDFIINCRIGGSWPEIKEDEIISIPQGELG